MYSIDIDKDIIIGIEEVSVDSLVPHEKVLIDKTEILKSSLKYKDQHLITVSYTHLTLPTILLV